MRYNEPANNPLQPKQLLTERELTIVQLTLKECTNKQIAYLLEISVRTVEKHKEIIRKKLGVLSVIGIVVYAMKHNLHLSSSYSPILLCPDNEKTSNVLLSFFYRKIASPRNSFLNS